MKTKKKARSLLSILLSAVMVTSLIPAGIVAVSAAPENDNLPDANINLTDYTDIDMDFNYSISDPNVVLKNNMNFNEAKISDKNNGTVTWKHATSFGPKSGNFRDYMESTNEDDKYIVVDNDLTTTSGHTDYETIVVKSNKILDLNGHLIRLMDKRNKVDTHDDYSDKYYQSNNSADFQSVMFSIENGATLTIIDSSSQQTGEIYINAYMIDPYAHRIKRYTTRDIFNVSDGNLVIYGGTYQAGRSKAQSDDDLFSKIETVVGNAVALATDIAGYATGINAATGAYEDAVFNAQQALDAIKKAGGNFDGDESAKTQQAADTKKKDGSDAKPEAKKDTPDGKENSDSSRNKTVSEKQDDKDKNKKNESNKNGSAQYDGNSKIAAAENAITDAAVNKDKIGSMVSSAFNLAKSIKSCFETNESSIVIQSFLGTVVNVGNGGTFVSYGGKYIGYGMTPNIRNAVVESTQQGKVYIYDGLFE